MTHFISKLLKVENLDGVVSKIWFIYVDKWRQDSLPLLSKFTFSNPGHFELNVNAKSRLGTGLQRIPERIINKLERQDENN